LTKKPTDNPSRKRLLELLEGIKGLPVLLLGDLVLDEFLYGDIGRVSREAPVLILDHTATVSHPGGAANALQNLCHLGAEVVPIGVVGSDASGDKLLDILRGMDIDTSEVVVAPEWETPTKTRILAGLPGSAKQQVLRVDRSRRGEPAEGVPAQLLAALRRRAGSASGLLISDYSYGATEEPEGILAVAGRTGLKVTVDSRTRLRSYRGITAATPNLEELEQASGHPIGDDENTLDAAGRRLRNEMSSEALLVTLGNRGMALFHGEADEPRRIAAFGSRDPVDVTGAGDTVISVFTLALLAGGNFIEAAELANIAAGLAVMKRGTAAVSADEIRNRLRTDPGGGR
jgi:rfaE bifunctional protein kinase chain/domain